MQINNRVISAMVIKKNEDKTPTPAATVIVIRDSSKGIEVLMLRRSLQMNFASGYWVFPGGKIEEEDYKAGVNNTDIAARLAAIRETQEESGLILNEKKLIFTSHWTSPKKAKTRFSTWYYATALQSNVDILVDNSEIIQYCWYRPAEALQDFKDKKINIMAPTFVTLTELIQCKNVTIALAMYCRSPIYYQPKTIKLKQGACALYEGDSGYRMGNKNTAGKRHRLMMLDREWHYIKDI